MITLADHRDTTAANATVQSRVQGSYCVGVVGLNRNELGAFETLVVELDSAALSS